MDRPFFVRTWCSLILYLRDDDGRLSMGEIREVYKDILAEYPNCGGFMPVDKFMAEVKRIVSYYMIQKHFSKNYYVLTQRSADKDKITNRSPQLSHESW